jgi:GntR family transcriptional regulator
MQSLQTGEWKPGEMIPSEMDLAARYKVSQGTVRKAIDELAADNLVARRQGQGHLRDHPSRGCGQVPFSASGAGRGRAHSWRQPRARVRLRAVAEIARLLDIRTGDSVVQIRRVLTFSNEVTVLDEPAAGRRRKGLTAEKLNEWKGLMYALFEAEFGTRMIRATEKIRAVAADDTAAERFRRGRLAVAVGRTCVVHPMAIAWWKSAVACMSRRATIIKTT